MHRRHRRAVQRGIELAPFAGGNDRACREAHEIEHRADADGIGGEHLAQDGDGRLFAASGARSLHGTLLGLLAGILQHGARQHVLGFRMRRHAEARYVDADDAHAVDLLRQQPKRHAGGGRDAEIDDDDGVVIVRVRELEDRLADIFEELARDERFGVERHVADGAARAVEVRREGEAVHAAGRARQDRRGAAHPQADAQRAESRAHALGLVVRTRRVILGIALKRLAHAGGVGRLAHLVLAGVAAMPVLARRRDVHGLRSRGGNFGRDKRGVRGEDVGHAVRSPQMLS